MHKKEYSFTWKIENFSFCNHKNGESLLSSRFYAKNFNSLSGYLKLCPRGKNYSYSNFISCSLYLNTVEHIDFLKCEIKAIGASGKILKLHKWKDISHETMQTTLEYPEFLTIKEVLQDAEGYEEDFLTICCKLYGKISDQNMFDGDIACTKIGVDRHTFKLQIDRGETAKLLISFGSSKIFEFYITETLGNLKPIISKLNFENEEARFVDCTLTLDKICQSRIYSERARHYFSSTSCSDWKFPSTTLSDEWNSYLNFCQTKNIYLYCVNIHCEFSFSSGTNLKFHMPKTEPSSIPNKADVSFSPTITSAIIYPSLQEDLRTLFQNKKLSDVKLRVEDEIIEVHKAVLVARSPVFAVMFDHQDMKETRNGIFDIVDIDVQTLKLFLQFLYTDTVDEMDYEVATNLMMVAEKYQVLSLKETCSVFLQNEMSVENVCGMLSLANAVNHENLISASIKFIIANSATILSSPQWMTWMKDNMELATAIFSKLTLSFSFAENETSGIK